MKKKYFYTLMRDGKFINSNSMKSDTEEIAEAIRFNTEEDMLYYWEQPCTKMIREDSDVKIIEVECILREYIV